MSPDLSARIGVVAIGRNEGERLKRCLLSALRDCRHVVYVDSGSTDGSIALARALGVEVVELDTRIPFTAARARNAGFRRLCEIAPGLPLVQFVDGDCELQPGWLAAGAAVLDTRANVGLACGRRRERHPEKSIYNRLCDFDWAEVPLGETHTSGGDFLVRREVFARVGGFRDDLIAGEEPELCVRIRAAGWKIWRLADEMTLHDAGMTRFSQWWKRTLRGGYAYSEGARLHGASPARHFVRQHRRILLWGLVLPLAILAAALVQPWALAAFLVYPLQVVRIGLRDAATRDGSRLTARDRWYRALFFVLARFPEAMGSCRYQWHRSLSRRGALIEYK